MLYTKHNISDLDLGKYKRFVAIGCSFTRWLWPTWSDLLAREMPNAKYVNTARGGAGNQYIVTMLNLLSRRHNFGPETLVGIMWSTFCREDRYVLENAQAVAKNGNRPGWVTPGNILNTNHTELLPESFCNKLEPFHYLIRDAGIISSANGYLKTANFDTLNICSLDMHQQIPYGMAGYRMLDTLDETDKLIFDTMNLYDDLADDFVGYLIKHDTTWPGSHEYPRPDTDSFKDYHPRSIDYADYLETWGIPLSDQTKAFAKAASDEIDNITDPNWQKDWKWPHLPPHQDDHTFYENHF